MKTKLSEEIFKMRFIDCYDQYQKRKLTCEEAAEVLGISISTFYRKRQIYREDKSDSVFDRLVGKSSHNRAPDHEVEFVTKLFESWYRDFSVKHLFKFT